MGLFGGGNPIDWANRSKCPPIDDCPVKNTVQKGRRPTKKEQREIQKAIAQQKAASRARRSRNQAEETKPEQKGMWPFVSYDPKRERGR